MTIESSPDGPVLLDAFTLKTTETEPGSQAVDLARLLHGRLPGLSFESAAIKTAGPSPVAQRKRAQFHRAHAEGALLYVLHEESNARVEATDANGLAALAGKKKDDLVAASTDLAESRYRDAAYAALAVLP